MEYVYQVTSNFKKYKTAQNWAIKDLWQKLSE